MHDHGNCERCDAIEADLVSARRAIDVLNERQRVEWARAESAEASLTAARRWVDDLQGGMYVNCVYCGHRYGPGETTPVSMADALKAHVEQCPDHPMSALRRRAEGLERALRSWAKSQEAPAGELCWCSEGEALSTMAPTDHATACIRAREALRSAPESP